MRPKKIAYVVVLLFLLPVVAMASPDEASGTVIEVVDGNTFAVRIEKVDPRIKQEVERVTLADLEVWDEATTIDESMNASIDESMNESIYEVPSAKDLAVAILLNKTVWLDIDDRSEDGRNSEGELVAILYLSGLDGRPVTSPSFNRMLVDYKIAELNDSDANEFDPADWWPLQENISIEGISAEEDSGVEEKDAGTKTTGLNIDINPTKPNVNVNISRPNIAVNPTKPKVNVNLTGLNVNVNPAKPSINVNPKKPVIDVNPTTTEPNATENETSEALSFKETAPGASGTADLPFANLGEPLVLNNSTVPITLINPTGSITVINSTGQVTLIDPAKPVKVINSTELATVAKSNDTEPSDIFAEEAAAVI